MESNYETCIVTLAACLFFTAGMQAQSIDEVLRQIEQNNKELQSQQHAARAAQLEVRTLNNLASLVEI